MRTRFFLFLLMWHEEGRCPFDHHTHAYTHNLPASQNLDTKNWIKTKSQKTLPIFLIVQICYLSPTKIGRKDIFKITQKRCLPTLWTRIPKFCLCSWWLVSFLGSNLSSATKTTLQSLFVFWFFYFTNVSWQICLANVDTILTILSLSLCSLYCPCFDVWYQGCVHTENSFLYKL